MSMQSEFFAKIKPFCYGVYYEFGVLPSVAAAQTALESNWGRSGLSSKYNNYHGIKAVAGYPSVSLMTKEDYGGGLVSVAQKFAHFPSPAGSFSFYGSLLKRRYGITGIKDAQQMVQKIKAGGYATDTQYVSKVMSVVNTHSLTKWDKDVFGGGKGGYAGDLDKTAAGSGSWDGGSSVELPVLEGRQFRTFNNNFIGKNAYTRPKVKIKGVNGIVLHDAGSKGLSASAVRTYMSKGGPNKKDGGLHIIVDSSNTVCIVPLDEKVYHANNNNKKSLITASDANDITVSVGMCRETNGSYSDGTVARAVAVCAELVNAFGFPVEAIVREYDINGSKDPEPFVENQFDYSAFLGVVKYQMNQTAPLMNEDLAEYYAALGGGGGSYDGSYTPWDGTLEKDPNAAGKGGGRQGLMKYVDDILKNEIEKKFKVKYFGGYSYRNMVGGSSLSNHAKGTAIDLFTASNSPDEEKQKIANYMKNHPLIKYCIYNKMYSYHGGPWKNYMAPGRNPHTDHVHVDFEPPGKGYTGNSGGSSSGGSSGSTPSVGGDLDPNKTYALKIEKTVTAYQTDSENSTTEQKYSSGNLLRVQAIGVVSYKVGDRAWIKKSDADSKYKLMSVGKDVNEPIGTGKITSSTTVKSRASSSSSNYIQNGATKRLSSGSTVKVYSKENGMFRISAPYEQQQWVAASYVDFTSKLKKVDNAPTGDTSGGTSSGGSGKDESGKYTGKEITVSATAYTARCTGCSGITATGVDVRNQTPPIIAVDPKVIPLHSKVYVPGWGVMYAEDTGGAIKGNKIDILVATNSEALKWGRRNIKIIVMSKDGDKEFHRKYDK